MTAIASDRVTDERVTCLRIFADAHGETHMEDVAITLQLRKIFKENAPFPISENFPAAWCNVCHLPAGLCEVGRMIRALLQGLILLSKR